MAPVLGTGIEALDQRRQQLLAAAQVEADALHLAWPEVVVRVFGSVLGPGFHGGSDLDLAVGGLPLQALLEAMALAEDQADAALARMGGGPVAVDLVRLEPCLSLGGRGFASRAKCSAKAHGVSLRFGATPARPFHRSGRGARPSWGPGGEPDPAAPALGAGRGR